MKANLEDVKEFFNKYGDRYVYRCPTCGYEADGPNFWITAIDPIAKSYNKKTCNCPLDK